MYAHTPRFGTHAYILYIPGIYYYGDKTSEICGLKYFSRRVGPSDTISMSLVSGMAIKQVRGAVQQLQYLSIAIVFMRACRVSPLQPDIESTVPQNSPRFCIVWLLLLSSPFSPSISPYEAPGVPGIYCYNTTWHAITVTYAPLPPLLCTNPA